MFQTLARIVLRHRRLLLVMCGLLTIFFGYMATKVQLSYDFAKVLPSDDPDFIDYRNFKQLFGEDGTVMVLGVKDSTFYTADKFNAWYHLGKDIKAMDGIEAVVSVSSLYDIKADSVEQRFKVQPLMDGPVTGQQQLDSLHEKINSLPFYKGFINSRDGSSTLMAVTFDNKKINTKSRIDVVKLITSRIGQFEKETALKVHISGMPFIRTAITAKVVNEMKLFLLLAIIVCGLILLIFFRSVKVVLFSLLVVLVGVIWSVGIIAIFDYKITILTGLIPPLIIVIGIPNSILLLNKYHTEYEKHGNKIRALARMVQRVGLTTFLANVTTSIGFGVFYFTDSTILMEFGLVAAINVMATYLISIVLIPAIFSFLADPEVKHTRHLTAPRISALLAFIDYVVSRHHRKVFVAIGILLLISFYGISKISTVGYVVDDLPKSDPVYVDMRFFESEFNGVLPLEIMVSTKEEGKALSPEMLQKINRLEKMLVQYDVFSKPLAVVDAIKYSYQSYRGGDAKYFVLPGSLELAKMAGYLKGDQKQNTGMFKSFIDSTRTITRISVQMKDVGSDSMKVLLAEIRPRVDSIFNQEEYHATLTGNSLIFLKGNDYLFENLMESIVLAIALICIIMYLLFMSTRMIAISILPSLIPLVITAGIMGFSGIALKPSTILIFSIAFGIASDGTIYFLTKYRHELKIHPLSISKAVSLTIRETGVSMIYTAVILFFGFLIFAASGFGGTASLGILISITLLVAMMSNLVLLPSFLIALERRITTKAFLEEPLIQVFDEAEEIELDDLEIRKGEPASDEEEIEKR